MAAAGGLVNRWGVHQDVPVLGSLNPPAPVLTVCHKHRAARRPGVGRVEPAMFGDAGRSHCQRKRPWRRVGPCSVFNRYHENCHTV